jgi:photosystem II stability/assembly factor-like uncharacterized protein
MRLFVLISISVFAYGQVDTKSFDAMSYRFIGPAGMGGRVTDVESVPGKPHIAYVGTGGGGLWKTMNGGTTWTPIFERQNTFSIGDIALDPQNPETIWVGTGEANPRNSVSFGDGVYRSTEGGASWQHMGLAGTERISRILVHPKNSNIVMVGALGHAYGPHAERGVFVTTDGGVSWKKTLYVDPSHGIADMDLDVANPNLVYAAVWKFERKPWTFTSGSEEGGIFRSTDGGMTWKKVTKGLPKLLGRVGVKVAPSQPQTVYVIAESKEGSLFRSDDYGAGFVKVTDNSDIIWRGFYFTDLRVDPKNENRLYALSFTVQLSTDGGKSWKDTAANIHPDMHAMWIDPTNPEAMWLGSDGGIASSVDRGAKWRYHNNIPLGQYYQIHADNRLPFYHLTGGQQDNSTWTGPSRTRDRAGIANGDWRLISGGDGFYALSDPDQPEVFLSESQGGRIVRTDLRTGEQKALAPSPRAGLQSEARYRFNWNTPIVASPHGKSTFYYAGNVIFQSSNFGKTWEPISPDLTSNEKAKYAPAGGPIFNEATTAENSGTVINLSESPVKAGVIWAGTDDGHVQVTVNGGKNWTDVVGALGVPAGSVISHVEASRRDAATAYVSVDRHMFDDFKPYVFRTKDNGKSFENITGNLPEKAYVQVIKEDPKNGQLLYAGTELGLFVSFEGGKQWQRLGLKNMPHVAVHDLLVHPRENDLVVATHGRGIAILDDITMLQQANAQVMAKPGHLFAPRVAYRMAGSNGNGWMGDQNYFGPNPVPGAMLTYWLKEKPTKEKALKIEIYDGKNQRIAAVRNPASEPGFQRVSWNLRHEAPTVRRESNDPEGGGGGAPGAVQALPGRYVVKMLLGADVVSETAVEVQVDPTVVVAPEDLKQQFDVSMRMRQMISGVSQALRNLDQVKGQLEQSEKVAEGAAKERVAAMKRELEAEMGRFEGKGVRYRVIVAPKLSEELGAVFGAVASGNSGPTEAQVKAVEELEVIYKREMAGHQQFVATKIAAWDGELRQLKLLGLSAVKATP